MYQQNESGLDFMGVSQMLIEEISADDAGNAFVSVAPFDMPNQPNPCHYSARFSNGRLIFDPGVACPSAVGFIDTMLEGTGVLIDDHLRLDLTVRSDSLGPPVIQLFEYGVFIGRR